MGDPPDRTSFAAEALRRGDFDGPVGWLRLGGTPLPLVNPARVYVCGITPYDVTHLGHAATFVWTDVAVRVMRSTGVSVLTCRNVTDVDDVLTRAAEQRGRRYDEFAATQEFMFDRAMRHLRVAPPTLTPRAGAHVGEVIQLAAALVALGAAYERAGRVFFRGDEVPARAGVAADDALRMLEEYGDEPADPLRESPFDVPLWVSSSGDEPAWPSPWGPGRPGWHAECAAMALAALGQCVDVLAGGADLAFPHHAYQSAMVAAFSGAGKFARVVFDVGTVCLDGAKMAKSTGNLVLVEDLLTDASPEQLRVLLVDREWSSPWDFRPADLTAAGARLERLRSAAGRPGTGTSAAAAAAAVERLQDDLDVPGALDLAEEAGGEAARVVLRTLALDA